MTVSRLSRFVYNPSAIFTNPFISTRMGDIHVSGIPETWNIDGYGQKNTHPAPGNGNEIAPGMSREETVMMDAAGFRKTDARSPSVLVIVLIPSLQELSRFENSRNVETRSGLRWQRLIC
jgi:hypothetical protein